MLCKSLAFFLFLLWSTQTRAMDGPDVNNDISRIETLVKKLREIDPVKFSKPDGSKLLLQEHLDFSARPEDISRLYSRVAHHAGGGKACVWKATLAKDRPMAGLKAGDTIAIRMMPGVGKPFKDDLFGHLQGLNPLIRLSHFKNLKPGEKAITDYFPNFYGVYYADEMPFSLVEGRYPQYLLEDKLEEAYWRYEEIEWVDTTFEDKQYCIKEKVPDSILFEWIYGEWTGQFFYGLTIYDNKPSNYGLKKVPYDRIYHLGEEDIYVFSSHEIPIRLDLDEFESQRPAKKRFGRALTSSENAASEKGRLFLEDLKNKRNDLFTLFKEHFSDYLIGPVKAAQQMNAKHFYLEQKYIDQERSLPSK